MAKKTLNELAAMMKKVAVVTVQQNAELAEAVAGELQAVRGTMTTEEARAKEAEQANAANIATAESVVAEALVELDARLRSVEERLQNLGNTKVLKIDSEDGYQMLGMDILTIGTGAPTVVPTSEKLLYFDRTNRVLYVSVTTTNAISDWMALA